MLNLEQGIVGHVLEKTYMCLNGKKIIEDRYNEFMKYFEKKITSKIVKVETNLESYRSEVTQFKTEIVKEIKAGNEDTKEIKEGFFIYIHLF